MLSLGMKRTTTTAFAAVQEASVSFGVRKVVRPRSRSVPPTKAEFIQPECDEFLIGLFITRNHATNTPYSSYHELSRHCPLSVLLVF